MKVDQSRNSNVQRPQEKPTVEAPKPQVALDPAAAPAAKPAAPATTEGLADASANLQRGTETGPLSTMTRDVQGLANAGVAGSANTSSARSIPRSTALALDNTGAAPPDFAGDDTTVPPDFTGDSSVPAGYTAAPSMGEVAQGALIERGQGGKNVEQLQERLTQVGINVQPDGKFGPGTERKIKEFQKQHGVQQTGKFGPTTLQALKQAEAAERPNFSALREVIGRDKVLAQGDAGAAVYDMQRALTKAGFGVEATGQFGPTTEESVKKFQAANGIQETGKMGPTTFAALEKKLNFSTDGAQGIKSDLTFKTNAEALRRAKASSLGKLAEKQIPKYADTYRKASELTGVPAEMIAAIHGNEGQFGTYRASTHGPESGFGLDPRSVTTQWGNEQLAKHGLGTWERGTGTDKSVLQSAVIAAEHLKRNARYAGISVDQKMNQGEIAGSVLSYMAGPGAGRKANERGSGWMLNPSDSNPHPLHPGGTSVGPGGRIINVPASRKDGLLRWDTLLPIAQEQLAKSAPTSSVPSQPTQPTQPTPPAEPTPPVNTQPTQPTQPTPPSQPTQPTEPAPPTNTQPTQPTQPTAPTQPTQPAQPSNSPLDQFLAQNPGVKTNQDMINAAYKHSNNTFDGATRFVESLGLKMNDLARDRKAPLQSNSAAPTQPTQPNPPVNSDMETLTNFIKGGGVLEQGAKGPEVEAMQRELTARGFGVQATGEFGPTTAEALKKFQGANNIEQTGKLGATTFEAFQKPQVQANTAIRDLNRLTTEAQRFDYLKALAEANGGKINNSPNKRNIISLRRQTDTDVNGGRGRYDDKTFVMWTDSSGKKHVKEYDSNTEPSAQYRGSIGVDANRDGRLDQGRLPAGYYEFTKGYSSKLGNVLRPTRATNAERDTNQDGLFNDNAYASAGESILFHKGSTNDTDSAGCQTFAPNEWNRFWSDINAAGNPGTVGYTLINVS
ncbi:MAG: peptidoglycan-binding protein [Myxococcales bacterium]|nr:peptidoglycan-binding protein [Myxococcales bacterium]MCB9644045.1 peptidoglycan-binding protein [Myxococcales bacterium]